MRSGSNAARKAVRRAADRTIVGAGREMPARYVDAGVAPELAVALEHRSKIDPLGVPEEPGGVVVLVALDRGDADGDIEGTAMPPKSAARWGGQ